jgi:hypothetical protein
VLIAMGAFALLAIGLTRHSAQDGRVSVHLNPKDFAAFFMLAKVQFRAIRAWQRLRGSPSAARGAMVWRGRGNGACGVARARALRATVEWAIRTRDRALYLDPT